MKAKDLLRTFGVRIAKLANPAMIAAAATLALAVGLAAQSEHPPQEKTAGEVYKNIQVLKDIPASQLLPGMRYITTALGVDCSFCHVQDNFPSDDKTQKQTARKMMQMLFAINKSNFDGRPEVSCYTCHQGQHEPMSVPKLSAEIVPADFIRPAEGAPEQPIPNADTVLANFAKALGGEDALAKITSRELQIDESRGGQTFTAEVVQSAPDKMYSVMTTPRGTMTSVFNGSQAWTISPRGAEEARDMNAIVLRREAEIDPAAALQKYTGRRVFGQAKIGDTMAYVMRAKAPDGEFEFLLFDEKTGLLLRRSIRYQTIFGSLPLEVDYADYRPVNGVQVPFKITWSTSGQSSVLMVKDVKDNVSVDESKFTPPEMKNR
jgi:photosynthetic reaction center cytochrome c subunit